MNQFYSLFDKKAVFFSPPILFSHVAEATRSVQAAMEDSKSKLAKWPADFALYVVGHWDGSTGCIMPTASGIPQLVIEIAALVPQGVSNA